MRVKVNSIQPGNGGLLFDTELIINVTNVTNYKYIECQLLKISNPEFHFIKIFETLNMRQCFCSFQRQVFIYPVYMDIRRLFFHVVKLYSDCPLGFLPV